MCCGRRRELSRSTGASSTTVLADDIVATGICHPLEGRRIFPRLTPLTLGEPGNGRLPPQGQGRHSRRISAVFTLFPRLKVAPYPQRGATLSGGEQQTPGDGRADHVPPQRSCSSMSPAWDSRPSSSQTSILSGHSRQQEPAHPPGGAERTDGTDGGNAGVNVLQSGSIVRVHDSAETRSKRDGPKAYLGRSSSRREIAAPRDLAKLHQEAPVRGRAPIARTHRRPDDACSRRRRPG